MLCKLNYMNVKGQAAILAVMLITGVALVSAGFAAFVANSIHHARALTGKISGKDIAMYGIEYAMQQLLTSPEGADWRPVQDPNLPWDAYEQRRGWNTQYVKYMAPNGYFLLKVSNRPDDYIKDDYIKRYIEAGYIVIDSIGRPEPKSPVYYRIIAIVPQPMIQYARFLGGRRSDNDKDGKIDEDPIDGIDNDKDERIDEDPIDEHVIGIGQIDFDGDGVVNQLEENSSIVTINGGIFSNGDLRIASQSLMKLLFDSANPNHGLFVAGESTVSQARVELCDKNGNPISSSSPRDSSDQNFEIFPLNGIPRYRDGYYSNKPSLGRIDIDVYRRLQPILPPTIDAERYRRLISHDSSGTQVIYIDNTQVIYVDNKGDIQDNIAGAPSGLKPAQVQFWDWVNVPPEPETDPRTRRSDPKSGWYYNPNGDPYRRNPPINNTLPDYFRYVPPGCEVELQGAGIVITRHDKPNDVSPISYYPVNSEKPVVIFAEGNVRIKGKIDASLTVISMGTIYIEGSLETADPERQHIALLAKHNVCLNTTALLPIIERTTGTIEIKSDDPEYWDHDKIPLHYEFPDSSPSSLTWRIPHFNEQGQKIRITLLHSGLGDPKEGNISIEITLNDSQGNPLYCAPPGEPLHYDPDNDGKIGEDPIDNIDNDGDGMTDEDSGQPMPCYKSGSSHGIYWIEYEFKEGESVYSVTVKVLNANEITYRLSRFKVELVDASGNPILWKIRINAAIYAESGCFFILPPPYFDNMLNLAKGDGAARFRRFNYFDIEINGSIAEYTTAVTMAKSIGLSDEEAVDKYRKVLDKLAYPTNKVNDDRDDEVDEDPLDGVDNDGDDKVDEDPPGWGSVRFRYDPWLLQYPPPFLPVSPRPIIIYSGL